MTASTARHDVAVARWRERGDYLDTAEGRVFVVDIPGPPSASELPPMLVQHGFPTCSFDWREVVDRFAATRRIVLFDFVGFGLSDKPDRRYSIPSHADTTIAVADSLGLERVALVTHDMGDSVGGELLARSLDDALGFELHARVVANGSIYLSLAHLTDGQQFLLALDDAPFDMGDAAAETFKRGLGFTFSSAHPASEEELQAQWQLVDYGGGHQLLPRTIRYIEDRRRDEGRYTGAIERHPSPLGIVWGVQDPVADVAMVDRLAQRRPDARVTRLDGVGHYPMVEAPEAFATSVLDLLDVIEA